jgi:hypothetical protein
MTNLEASPVYLVEIKSKKISMIAKMMISKSIRFLSITTGSTLTINQKRVVFTQFNQLFFNNEIIYKTYNLKSLNVNQIISPLNLNNPEKISSNRSQQKLFPKSRL